jgi:hypothetical protein
MFDYKAGTMQKCAFLGVLFFCSFILSKPSSAGDTRLLFKQLLGTKVNYQKMGTICEQAARLMLEDEYPRPNYTVETDIEYMIDDRITGELDVVVFDSWGKAILVAEVKCTQSEHSEKRASRYALSQLKRFKRVLSSHVDVQYRQSLDQALDAEPGIEYYSDQFDDSIELISIGPSPVEGDSAFNKRLDYTWSELDQVRKQLISKQSKLEKKKSTSRRARSRQNKKKMDLT